MLSSRSDPECKSSQYPVDPRWQLRETFGNYFYAAISFNYYREKESSGVVQSCAQSAAPLFSF